METFSIALLKLVIASLVVLGLALGAIGLFQCNFLAPLGFVLLFTALLGSLPFLAELTG